jgi:hypothetical protein
MRNEYIIDLQKLEEKLKIVLYNLISLALVKRDLSDENILCAISDLSPRSTSADVVKIEFGGGLRAIVWMFNPLRDEKGTKTRGHDQDAITGP